MGENTKLSIMIEYVNNLKQIWGMTQNDLSDWLGTAASTITGWKDYKWTQVSKGHIRLVAIYCGESIEDADGLKKEFKRLAENEGCNGDYIFNVITGKYDNTILEEEIKAVRKLILDEYLKRKNLTGASERIKEFIEEKYSSFLKNEQIQNNDTNKPSEDASMDNDTPMVKDSPEQPENTEADTSEVEDSSEQPEDTEADTSEVKDSPEQPEDTEADASEVEDSLKQPEDTEADTSEVKDSPEQPEDTEADASEVEDSLKQPEDTEADTSEVKDSPEQPEDTEADTSEVEDSPEPSEDADYNTLVTEGEIESLGGINLLKIQGEYGEATELGEHIEYLMCAAEVGDRDANFELGLAYKDGKGVIKNSSKAVEYFFEAGKLGSGDAVYELKECYRSRVGVEKKQAGRKEMWLRMVLKANHYKHKKHMVDISMDLKLSSKERLKYVKKWHEFFPETDEERRLKELIEIWGGIEY